MNNITITARYTGHVTTDKGIYVLTVDAGKGDKRLPFCVVPSWAAEETGKEGCFEKGQKILINGLAYPTDRKHGDGMFYVVPTNKFQAVPDDIEINQLTIAGRAFINDGKNPKVANLGIYCPVRKQDYINVSPPNQFSLPFRVEAWDNDDPRRAQNATYIRNKIQNNTLVSLGCMLKYRNYVNNEGVSIDQYRFAYRSNQLTTFTEKKQEVDKETILDTVKEYMKERPTQTKQQPAGYDSPHQQAISRSTVEDDDIPF